MSLIPNQEGLLAYFLLLIPEKVICDGNPILLFECAHGEIAGICEGLLDFFLRLAEIVSK